MKSIALICVFLLLPLHYALATTKIFIDGVVDATPDQSFSRAGGAILIKVMQDNKGDGISDTDPILQAIVAGLTKQRHLQGEAHKFGDDIKFQIKSREIKDSSQNIKHGKSLKIFVKGQSRALLKSPAFEVDEIIKIDPEHPLVHRFRIRVTHYTPGPAGTTGQGTIIIQLERI